MTRPTAARIPATEPDWQPLRRAILDTLFDQKIFISRSVVTRFTAAVIDQLEAERVELIDRTDHAET